MPTWTASPNNMLTLIFTKNFGKAYTGIINNNKDLEKKVRKALHLLEQDPFYPSLKTHKAGTKNYGARWSSWVTGDIRIIWDYDEEDHLVLLLLDIGSHSGTHKVYK